MLNQISIFVENKSGRLNAIMKTLNNSGIDVRALTIADTTDFGIVRIIVNDTDKAIVALKENNFTAKITSVIGFTIQDRSGALYDVIKMFDEHNLNVEYCYSLMGKNQGEADIAVRVDNPEKAVEILKAKGIKLISLEDIG